MHPSASRGALVGMMEAAEDRHRTDRSQRIRPLLRWRLRERLAAPLVRPRPVEVGGVLPEHAAEVALPQDEDVIEALAPDAAEEALAQRIRPRRAKGRA